MFGPELLARTLTVPWKPDRYGNLWQYHPRSDRHSKIGCWGVAFDLLTTSSLLREHAIEGKVILGVNHQMVDHSTSRRKALDLVIARPGGNVDTTKTFRSLAREYGISLDEAELAALEELPDIPVAPVGAVLVALEAKATMTEHTKARPRLYDELNSSHLTVHGASSQALAIAYVQINAAGRFASPTRNGFTLDGQEPVITENRQPAALNGVLAKIEELPLRSATRDSGFDGIGITVLSFDNLGDPIEIVTDRPAPQRGDRFEYSTMIIRMANEYDSKFARI